MGRVAKPVGRDGGIEIVSDVEAPAPIVESTDTVSEEIPLSDIAGCRVKWPLQLSEVQACLVQGVVDDLETKYLRARVKNAQWNDQSSKAAHKIMEQRSAYETVANLTGVPWWLIGCLHMRESYFNFSTWLANGDPLSAPTVRVPAGLKCEGAPPWQWFDAAVVSLNHENSGKKVIINTVGVALDYAEHYNGLGYRNGAGKATTPPSTSPYLWSGTTEYEKGKYVSDGKFDANAVDKQLGVAVVMKRLQEMGVELFDEDMPSPVPPLPVSWFEIYRSEQSNIVVGYAGPDAVIKVETRSIESLIAFLKSHEGAKTWRVAPPGKPVPDTNPKPAPAPVPPKKVTPHIKLTRAQSEPDTRGLVPLRAEFIDELGQPAGSVVCVSGLPGAQAFRKGPDSKAGSAEPAPHGQWTIGNMEWAGKPHDYAASWGSGLGPLWIALKPQFETARSGIGFHRDDGVVGTLGCVGISDTEQTKRFVALMEKVKPSILNIDYGLM